MGLVLPLREIHQNIRRRNFSALYYTFKVYYPRRRRRYMRPVMPHSCYGCRKQMLTIRVGQTEGLPHNSATRDTLSDSLTKFRLEVLPNKFKWNDGEGSSNAADHAILRAKVYHTQFLIHRPFLRHALELDVQGSLDDYMLRYYGDSTTGLRNSGPGLTSDASLDQVLNSAKICIEAACSSITIFDKIFDHRQLVIPNIFGKAHA